jgi:FG-GAP repeat
MTRVSSSAKRDRQTRVSSSAKRGRQTRILSFAVSSVMLFLFGSTQTHAQAIAQGRLLASDAAPQNNFSQSMDIDGDIAVVSNSTATQPYVFERVNGVWTEVARLAPGESTVDYNYGIDVAVSGNTIAVGALKTGGALPRFGVVYLFEKISGSWTKVAKLTAANANTPQDGIGGSIDLSGNRLVVGDPGFNGLAIQRQGKVQRMFTSKLRQAGNLKVC